MLDDVDSGFKASWQTEKPNKTPRNLIATIIKRWTVFCKSIFICSSTPPPPESRLRNVEGWLDIIKDTHTNHQKTCRLSVEYKSFMEYKILIDIDKYTGLALA